MTFYIIVLDYLMSISYDRYIWLCQMAYKILRDLKKSLNSQLKATKVKNNDCNWKKKLTYMSSKFKH